MTCCQDGLFHILCTSLLGICAKPALIFTMLLSGHRAWRGCDDIAPVPKTDTNKIDIDRWLGSLAVGGAAVAMRNMHLCDNRPMLWCTLVRHIPSFHLLQGRPMLRRFLLRSTCLFLFVACLEPKLSFCCVTPVLSNVFVQTYSILLWFVRALKPFPKIAISA